MSRAALNHAPSPELRLRLAALAHAEEGHHQFALVVDEFDRGDAGAAHHIAAVQRAVAQVQVEVRIEQLNQPSDAITLLTLPLSAARSGSGYESQEK